MNSCFSSQRIKNFQCLFRNPKESGRYSKSRTWLSLLQIEIIRLSVIISIKKKEKKKTVKRDIFKIFYTAIYLLIDDPWMVPGIGHAAPRPVTAICSSYLCMPLVLGLSYRAEKPGTELFLVYKSEVANWCLRFDMAHRSVLFGLQSVL